MSLKKAPPVFAHFKIVGNPRNGNLFLMENLEGEGRYWQTRNDLVSLRGQISLALGDLGGDCESANNIKSDGGEKDASHHKNPFRLFSPNLRSRFLGVFRGRRRKRNR